MHSDTSVRKGDGTSRAVVDVVIAVVYLHGNVAGGAEFVYHDSDIEGL